MNGPRVFARLVLLLAFLLSGVISGVGSVGAQTGAQSYTSSLTGQSIQTSGVWTIDVDSIESGDGMEMISLFGQFDGMIVAFLPAGTDLVAARDVFLGEFGNVFDSLVQIDRGAYGNVSYSLDITSSEGIEFGLFSLFLGQRESGFVEYYLYFAPVMAFQQSMATAQQSVTVGGNKVFDGVDPAGLQTLLTANAGVTGASTQVPDQNVIEAPTEAPVPQPTQAPVTASSSGGAAYIQTIQGELTTLQGTLNDFIVNFAALQGDTVDTAVTEINRVSTVWIEYPDHAATILAPAGFEDIDASYQALAADVGNMGTNWRLVVDAIQTGDQASIQQALEDFLAVMNGVQDEIDSLNTMLTTAGAADAPTQAPPPAATEAPSPTEEVQDLTNASDKTSTRPGVNLPGKSTGTRPGQNETETGKGGNGSDLAQYEDLGLVSDSEYVSPQHDVGIVWDETWRFDPSIKDAITSNTESEMDSLSLAWEGEGSVVIFISVAAAGDVTPAALGEYWASDEYMADTSSPDAEILLHDTSRSGAVSLLVRDYTDDGTEVSLLRSVSCADAACGTLAIVTMFGVPEAFADAYTDARSGIEIDGERLLDVFSGRDVSGALGG